MVHAVCSDFTPVPEAEVRRWVEAAHTSRLASLVLDQVQDPLEGSSLDEDDKAYPWEKCSAWVRSNLVAATDHLVHWANVVAPQTVYDGMTVSNPPRPYYTLARAGLECAAQAVWVLDHDASPERVERHLRLLYHDLRQMALAFETIGDDRAAMARHRMTALAERLGDAERLARIKKHEPRYSSMVRETAGAIGLTPNDAEFLWRSASAAAHGKSWFQHVAYTATVGEQYEPGYFRAALQPDPTEITRSVRAAAKLTLQGVVRFAARAGHDPSPLVQAAFSKLKADTPQEDNGQDRPAH